MKDLSVTEEPKSEETAQPPEQQPAAPTGIPGHVPSRRVRDPPGGKDSLKNFWD